METEFLHDYENFSNFGSQGNGLNLSGTFFEKVSDHELAFQDDIPQPDYWLSPLDDYGSSSLSPTALSLRGDSCDFSLRDLNHAFDATNFQHEDADNLDSWNSVTDELAGYPDFLSIKQDPDQNFCDSIHNSLAHSDVGNERNFSSGFFPTEDEGHVDVETVDSISETLERKSCRQSFQPTVSSPVRSNLVAKPVKPCSLLEKHLRSPIETIINAAQRPNSINSCNKLNNCRIIRESSTESSNSNKHNARKHKIPIAQAIPGKKHESSSNRMIDAGRTLNRNKLIKLVTTGSSGETILLDHDYCSNNSKSGFVSSPSEFNETKRVPNRCEPTSTHFFANKPAFTKSTNNAAKPKRTAKNCLKIGSTVKPKADVIDAPNVASNKLCKIKSCDTETAFNKDIVPGNIEQSSATKVSYKNSVRIEESYCDSKIAQTDVPAKKKSSQKKPIMVSLLNKSTMNKDSSKEALLGDPDHNKSGRSKVLASQGNSVSGKVKPSYEKSHTPMDCLVEPNNVIKGAEKKQKDNIVRNGSILISKTSSTKYQDWSPAEMQTINKSSIEKPNARPAPSLELDEYNKEKKLKRKNKKLRKSPQPGSTSHTKDSSMSAKNVNTSSKNSFKCDSNLPLQNLNVISSDTKKANNENSQTATRLADNEEMKYSPIWNLVIKKEDERKSSEKSRHVLELPNNSDAENASRSLSASQPKVPESTENDVKLPMTETEVQKDVNNHFENKSSSEIQSSGSAEQLKKKNENPSLTVKQEDTIDSQLESAEKQAESPLHGEHPKSQAETGLCTESSSVKIKTEKIQDEYYATAWDPNTDFSAQSEEDSTPVGDVTSTKLKKDDGHHVKSFEKKRKLNLSEYRDRQRKRLDPGVTLISKWEVPLIDLDGITDPANRRSYKDLLDKVNEPKVIEPSSCVNEITVLEVRIKKTSENLKTSEKGNELSEELKITVECKEKRKESKSSKEDGENSDKRNEASENARKQSKKIEKSCEDQEVLKKDKENNDAKNKKNVKSTSNDSKKTGGDGPSSKEKNKEGAKKGVPKKSSKSSKEANLKRRSSSSNDSDRSSEHSKRCRSSRSSSAPRKSSRLNRRRTPISYRPSSRSSFSSNSSSSSSSSRSSSRSRSHSRSRSYGSRSYRYRNGYRRRSRDSDRRSRDHYRYQDYEDRHRSRSREDRRRSNDARRRSREDRRRSRDNIRRSKNYRRGRSSSSGRKTRSISPIRSEVYRPLGPRNYNISAQDKAIAEGRMIYVGKISKSTTKSDLYDRFEEFGPVLDISLYLRNPGYSYGFITYKYACDARSAIKHGNDNKSLPEYDIGYGGGRQVCSNSYSDLIELYGLVNLGYSPYDSISTASPVVYDSTSSRKEGEDSFDALLQDFRRAVAERTQKEI